MMKKIVSVCITGILVYGICGCAQTAENTPYAGTETVETENTEIESEEKTHTEDAETTVKGEENRHSGEGIVSPESVVNRAKQVRKARTFYGKSRSTGVILLDCIQLML